MTTAAKPLPDQVLSIEINAPVERVWREITKTGAVQRASNNTVLESAMKPGSKLRYYSPSRKRVFVVGEIVEISAPRKFSHTRSEEHTSELQSLAYLVCR